MAGSRLVDLQNHGLAVPLRAGGIAFVLCPLFLVVAAAPVSEAGRLVAAAAGLVLFAVGLSGLRQLATGLGLPALITVVAIIGITAEVVGTVFQISGVAIATPLLAAIALVLYASRWRAGDLSLMGFALGLGFGVAYVVDNIVHDDNGSATDQAVPVLVVPSIALALWVLARVRAISRAARGCLIIGAALAFGALIVALGTGEDTFVVLAVPAGLLFGVGLAATGVSLIRLGAASLKADVSSEPARPRGG